MSYIFEKTQVQAADSGSVDAFGRWRVSNPVTLFDGRTGYSDDRTWSNALVSGTMTGSLSNPLAAYIMTSTANTAGRRVRQSLKRFNYTPGKSHLILCSFVLGASVGGNKKRVGYFDDNNGLFLQQDGSEVSFNRRTYVTSSAVDNKVLQADWSLDTMDGTGPSGITVDFTKTQILVIDFEWLGVGRVRMGFNIDGVTYYCHEFLNANNLDNVYMSTGSLPIRYEMEHSGTGESSSFKCICSTVISEGGSEQLGAACASTSGLLTGLTAGSIYPLLGIRLKAAQSNGPVVKLTGFDVLGTTTNDAFAWHFLRDPVVTGTLTYNGFTDSSVEIAIGGSAQTVAVPTADIISGGVGFSRTQIVLPTGDDVQLETDANGNPIPFILAIQPYTSLSAAAAMRWRQYN